jgi:hypothetical protein
MKIQLVKESISFERGLDPKKVLGIGDPRIVAKSRVGTVDYHIVKDYMEIKAVEIGGAFEIYLPIEKLEELYHLFHLLDEKDIKIKGIDEDDMSYNTGYKKKIRPWLDKGWEIFNKEDNYYYHEFILIKY